jgi:hypothetical protein
VSFSPPTGSSTLLPIAIGKAQGPSEGGAFVLALRGF